jgi:hypothetical protein
MKRRRIAALIGAALVLPGLGLGIALTTAGADAAHAATGGTASATATTQQRVLLDCALKPTVKPGSYVIACADGNAGLQKLHWTAWAAKEASGYGTFYENDCTPTCVGGHFHSYPALIMAWGSGRVPGHPADLRYTELTLIFPGARPPVFTTVNGKQVVTHPLTQTFPAN